MSLKTLIVGAVALTFSSAAMSQGTLRRRERQLKLDLILSYDESNPKTDNEKVSLLR